MFILWMCLEKRREDNDRVMVRSSRLENELMNYWLRWTRGRVNTRQDGQKSDWLISCLLRMRRGGRRISATHCGNPQNTLVSASLHW